MTKESGFDSQPEQEIFLFSEFSSWLKTRSTTQWTPTVCSFWVKQHSAEVKKGWNYTSSPTISHNGMVHNELSVQPFLISPCWMVFIYISPLSNENSILRKNYSPGLFFTPPYMSSDTFVICLSVNSKLTIVWSNIILVHFNRYNSLGLLFVGQEVCDWYITPALKSASWKECWM